MARSRPVVVHLITRLELGGAQQNTLYCLEHHDRERFAVGLWAGAGGILDERARAIRDADVRILPWLRHPIAPARDAAALFRLASMLDGVDLVHTHSSKAGILGRAAARLAGTPGVVHTVHGWSFNETQSAATRRAFVELERQAARATDRIVCVSAADRETGLSLGIGEPSRYRILRSGIDRSLYAQQPGAREAARAALGFGPGDVVVGSITNLKPQKAPLDFIEAARLAIAREPRLRFFAAGDGELRRAAEERIAAAGLGHAVRLLGWREDVAELLAAMDLFVLTSLFEGLPRAVLQAMAASVPVIATDAGGTSEVVGDGAGILVPRGDPAAVAEAIVSLAADPAGRRRHAAAGAARLGTEFDIASMVARLEDLYEEVLSTGPAKRSATPTWQLGGVSARH
ncbi:MAG TPA: glycosyltransferase family 4 protein [Candidatus Polarisedimenticolaceae bacterium]|nr:glycosyltransferase family 4 protein [Candidatus Polarisedimenticolaceae bacterium]